MSDLAATTSGGERTRAPARGGATAWLVAGGVAAFGLFLLALAFPPDLQAGGGGAHALSRSAVGYAGVVQLLQATGVDARVSRVRGLPVGAPSDALLVLTPEPQTPTGEITALMTARRVLVIAPKWRTVADPRTPGRVMRIDALPPRLALDVADAVLARAGGGAPSALVSTARIGPQLLPVEDETAFRPQGPLPRVQQLRAFAGPAVTPVATDAAGRALVARSPNLPVYVLSDPDLIANHALADPKAARAAVALLADLADGAPIVWDVTLNGFADRAPVKSPLKALFLPPFLPATLCLFVAAALTGLAARARFGAVEDTGRAYAFGKRALADSAASLIALAGREPAFAPRYAELARAAAVEAAGLSALGRDAQDAALDRIGAGRGVGAWSQVRAAAQSVVGGKGLLASARRTWTWRREMTRGRG